MMSSSNYQEKYLTPEQVATRYGEAISTRTLSNWRSSGKGGPPYTKIGGRVLYPQSKLVEWEEKRTVSSTAEYKA